MDLEFKEVLEKSFDDACLSAKELPQIDLYMDQVLTLFNEGLSKNKRHPQDVMLTKMMVNNYSKKHLIMPIKGKKYSREQLIQLLCILNMKQNLSMADIKTLVSNVESAGEVSFESAYTCAFLMKEQMRTGLQSLAERALESEQLEQLEPCERLLALSLLFSSSATYMRRICENMLDFFLPQESMPDKK